MSFSKRRIAVLGCGSWGTALAHHLRSLDHEVCISGREKDVLEAIEKRAENPVFFPGQALAKGISAESDLQKTVKGKDIVVFAVPSQAMRQVTSSLKGKVAENTLLINAAKGLEEDSLKRMSEVISEELAAKERIAVLSGPSFALEVVQNQPTAVAAAAENLDVAEEVRDVFHGKNFRVYWTTDVVGVELGGVLKNVMAIAAGLSDGLGFGHNARAALLTRGLREIERLSVSLGGKTETVTGLSGLGDLLLTATGDLSRNRRVGLALAKGKDLDSILKELGQVAEGVKVASMAVKLAKHQGVEMPITSTVNAILERQTSVESAIEQLLSRAPATDY